VALVLADRVKETSTTTGTGTYTLAGAVTGFESFGSIGNGNTTYYACTLGSDFEVGIGTYTSSGTTLARTTILQSSNSDNAVNWGAGTKTLFCTQPAEKAVFRDASGNVSVTGDLTVTSTDASADEGPVLSIYRNSSSPADADAIGIIKFDAEDDADNQTTYAQMEVKINDASNTTEDGAVNFKVMSGGAMSHRLQLQGNGKTNFYGRDVQLNTGVNLIFEGATSNANETTLTVADPSGDRTITLPDATGTVQLTDGSGASLTSLNASELSSGTVPNARLDAQLQDVAGLAVTNGNFIVGDGSNFVAESGSTARTSLGLGTAATLDTGISNTNVPKFTSGVADNDFLRVDGTAIEGRSASEVLSDIGAITASSTDTLTNKTINASQLSGTVADARLSSAVLTTSNSDAPATTTSSGDADFVLIDDGGTMKKITPANLGVPANKDFGLVTGSVTGTEDFGSVA
jgi:hypothetical protein